MNTKNIIKDYKFELPFY